MKKILFVSILIFCFLESNFQIQANITTPTTMSTKASHAVIYNIKDKRIVYDKGANNQIYPASMTKIMTSIVALDKIDDLNQKVIMNAEAFIGLEEANASLAGFEQGQEVTYHDLLAA